MWLYIASTYYLTNQATTNCYKGKTAILLLMNLVTIHETADLMRQISFIKEYCSINIFFAKWLIVL